MIDRREFRRGDVVLASLPLPSDPSTAKIRPAVVVQNDVGNRFSANLIVAGISSQLPRRPYPTNLIVPRSSPEGQGTGLDFDSVVQTEVILTVAKGNVVRRLGRFPETAMRQIDECLGVSLGLSRRG